MPARGLKLRGSNYVVFRPDLNTGPPQEYEAMFCSVACRVGRGAIQSKEPEMEGCNIQINMHQLSFLDTQQVIKSGQHHNRVARSCIQDEY